MVANFMLTNSGRVQGFPTVAALAPVHAQRQSPAKPYIFYVVIILMYPLVRKAPNAQLLTGVPAIGHVPLSLLAARHNVRGALTARFDTAAPIFRIVLNLRVEYRIPALF